MCCNRSLFGGNTCTWVLILVLVFLLVKQNDGCGCENNCNNCNNCANETAYTNNSYGCGCGCGC